VNRVPPPKPEERNTIELIRFASKQDRIRAIGALVERGMLNYSSSQPDVWAVMTPVARKLRELGVPFEWINGPA
jgi:hypothetical protein